MKRKKNLIAILLLVVPLSLLGLIWVGIAHGLEPGLQARDDIIFSSNFESDHWHEEWGLATRPFPRNTVIIGADPDLGFEALEGNALRIKVREDRHYGNSFSYYFQRQTGEEPEEVYFRYYLRFADDWNPALGGKLPGISGTYWRAGWGGRRPDGTDGWSARGLFHGQRDGRTPTGFYCSHVGQPGRWGSEWRWDRNNLGYLENNRWYSIEQYVKLNTPGQNDGIIRGWVNEELAFERTDIRFRDVGTLKIFSIWVNVYYGGGTSAQSDHHLYIDNVVIARSRIGQSKRILE